MTATSGPASPGSVRPGGGDGSSGERPTCERPTWRTALVTGASSGIGREIARRLADEGTNLVVVARDEARLKSLAAEVAVDVEVLPADLAHPAQLRVVEARAADAGRPVDLVVNDAAFGTHGAFAGLDVEVETREIAVNVTAVVRLTHAALGGMLARRRGAVMNLSSVAGLQATPGNATYGASKAFLASFGEAVAGEVSGTGVTVTTVLPGYTRTEFAERAGVGGRKVPEPAWMSADRVAALAIEATRAGRPWLVPGALNKALVSMAQPVPRGLKRRIAARLATHG